MPRESSKKDYVFISKQLDACNRNIDKVSQQIEEIRCEDIPRIQVEIATLKTKAATWGAIAGALPAIIALLLSLK